MLKKIKEIKINFKEYLQARKLTDCGLTELQNMILDDKEANLCKRAWKIKTGGLSFPLVLNQNKEVCCYVNNRLARILHFSVR